MESIIITLQNKTHIRTDSIETKCHSVLWSITVRKFQQEEKVYTKLYTPLLVPFRLLDRVLSSVDLFETPKISQN